MKAVILAGGLGTRIAEESDAKPKPMIEVGGRPILWHIMNHYASHGITDFVICLGYKGYMIKEFFFNYHRHMSDLRIDLSTGEHEILSTGSENWKITLVDTGPDTMTGGRLARVKKYVEDETFCLTYGDGLSDIDLGAELAFHRSHGSIATVAAVQPPGRFGVLELGTSDKVTSFSEKPSDEIGWINGGFFILERGVFNYLEGDETIFEREPLQALAADGHLHAFTHGGFWQPMDTLRDKRELEALWASGSAPWAV